MNLGVGAAPSPPGPPLHMNVVTLLSPARPLGRQTKLPPSPESFANHRHPELPWPSAPLRHWSHTRQSKPLPFCRADLPREG